MFRILKRGLDGTCRLPGTGQCCRCRRGLGYHGESLPLGSTTYTEEQFSSGEKGFAHFNRGLKIHELPRVLLDEHGPASCIQRRKGGVRRQVFLRCF